MEFDNFTLNSPAKINLCLHINGKSNNNYHLLSSLICFTELADKLTFTPATEFELNITGKYSKQLSNIDIHANLITKSLELICGNLPKIKIHLEKNLPVAAGIGGGSSNAAISIKAIHKIMGTKIDYNMALKLGADVPVCLFGKSAIVNGIGEIISPVKLPKLYLLLVNPNIRVNTAEVFKNFAKKIPNYMNKLNIDIQEIVTVDDLILYLQNTTNQLQTPAIEICPKIRNILDEIDKQDNCLLSRMSGSGATCFGIFKIKNDTFKAKENLSAKYPNWWVEATTTI